MSPELRKTYENVRQCLLLYPNCNVTHGALPGSGNTEERAIASMCPCGRHKRGDCWYRNSSVFRVVDNNSYIAMMRALVLFCKQATCPAASSVNMASLQFIPMAFRPFSPHTTLTPEVCHVELVVLLFSLGISGCFYASLSFVAEQVQWAAYGCGDPHFLVLGRYRSREGFELAR
jgi:hypothetical protein